MAGGPSTPELIAAVGAAGGLGIIPGGYLSPEGLAEKIAATRSLGASIIAVNLFVPGGSPAAPGVVGRYRETLAADAERAGVTLPQDPHFDDDHFPGKFDVLLRERVDAVTFTFGVPHDDALARLSAAGIATAATLSSAADLDAVLERPVDAVVVQGAEAGGHRSTFAVGEEPTDESTLELLRAAAGHPGLRGRPVIAAGGVTGPEFVRAALDAGASAVQAGTAFLLSAEAGTREAHRTALTEAGARGTRATRAFSGRPARSLVNTFLEAHDDDAPAAYPEVHHLTSPLRAAAASRGDAEALSLWAGAGTADLVASLRNAGLGERPGAAEVIEALRP
ncbi:nitronate monooxygenase [Falsarthrobacter nasiphocae]